MRTDYDVIVVGGGPAGSTAARRAAQQGGAVVLLDAAAFPRLKPCGGAVSEQAMSYLDFPLRPDLVHAEIFGARVRFGESVVEVRNDRRIAVLTSRSDLDAFLLSKAAEAGAHVLEGTRVTRVEDGPEYAAVHTASRTYRARYVIGADGAQSVVARAVRPPLRKHEYAVTFEFDVPCPRRDPPEVAGGLIELHLGDIYRGYGWVFPKRRHWNVGVGALASRRRNIKQTARDFYDGLQGLSSGEDGGKSNAVGWVVPAGGYRRRLGQGRLLLAGDAAGFVDPLYGEGIAYAVLSGGTAGALAGKAAGQRHGGNATATQKQYSSFCSRAIEANLRCGLLFARLLYAWPNGLLRLFSTNREFLQRYLEVPAARLTYPQYLRWFAPRALLALLRMPLRG
jgi:geranylgeranyl reductase family protein